MRIATSMVLAGALLVSGCSRGVPIAISNQSGSALENLVASGTGFSMAVGELAPGVIREVRVAPKGEGGLRLTFAVSGKAFDTGNVGYFEGNGYCVAATIAPTFVLGVKSKLQPC